MLHFKNIFLLKVEISLKIKMEYFKHTQNIFNVKIYFDFLNYYMHNLFNVLCVILDFGFTISTYLLQKCSYKTIN